MNIVNDVPEQTPSLTLPSPAKVNWFLRVLQRRPNGYHDLQTVFQFVDLCDQLTFFANHDDQIHWLGQTESLIPLEQNLIYRAMLLFRRHTGIQQKMGVIVDKRIPMGAGLGGGSSNAATTLWALNQLWETSLTQEELMALGVQLGADVPIFVAGYAAWGEGIGEQLTPMILPQKWLVLINPGVFVETAVLFRDPQLVRHSDRVAMSAFETLVGQNDFEPVVRARFLQIDKVFLWLSQYAPAYLSGSGATVFAAFDTQHEASKIASLASEVGEALVVSGLNQSPLHTALAKL